MNDFDSNDSNNDPLKAAFDNLVERRSGTTNEPLALQRIESDDAARRTPWMFFGSAALVGSAAIIVLALVLTSGGDETNVEVPGVAEGNTVAPTIAATTPPTSVVDSSPAVTVVETAPPSTVPATTINTAPTTGPLQTFAPVVFPPGSPEAAIQAEYTDPARYFGPCAQASNLSSDTEVCSTPRDGSVDGATIYDMTFLEDVGQPTDFGGGFYLREIAGAWTVVDSFSLGETFRVDNNGVVTIEVTGDRSEIWRPANPNQFQPPVQTSLYNTIWFSVAEPEVCTSSIYQVKQGEVTAFIESAKDPAIASDGRSLVYLAASGPVLQGGACAYDQVVVRDLITGQEVRETVAEAFADYVSLGRPTWNPAGTRLAVAISINPDSAGAIMLSSSGNQLERVELIQDVAPMNAALDAATENLNVGDLGLTFVDWTADGGYSLLAFTYAEDDGNGSAVVEFDADGNFVRIVSVDDIP